MRSFPICTIIILFFVVCSCSKEKSFEQKVQNPGDSTGTPATGLLVRAVGKRGGAQDSTIYTFTYDSNKKIKTIFTTTVGLVDEQYSESETRYYRNSSGMLDRYVRAESVRFNNRVDYDDSIVYKLHYNGTHYIYSTREIPNFPDPPVKDSIVYSYDNKDRISTVVVWRKDELNGNQLFELQKTVYTYDTKNNIAEMSITFKDHIDTDDPPQVLTFTYGNKFSALDLGIDGGALEGFISYGFSSPSNLLGMDNPDIPQRISYSYEFDNNSKPVKAVETDLLTNEKINISYYYQ
ncbi:MAG: hypothetical protein J0I84_17220 [Terrimonas sp.]|nr:hypothetical protein [Terrimonas sp.]